MYKRKSLAEHIRRHLLVSAAAIAPFSIPLVNAAEQQEKVEDDETEVITVQGVRNSLKDAAFMKKSGQQILDAISAEDIGQLPDNNIAEALQRVTGVQIQRDGTGQGSGVQVRGLTQNRVEINGQGMGSGGDERSNSFSAVDSALFAKIEVIKSPTADMVEGATGATVRLHTFKPLDFKKPIMNMSLQGTQDEIADDTGFKGTWLGTTRFDLGSLGEVGVLVNSAAETSYRDSHTFNSNWAPLIPTQATNSAQLKNLVVFRPDNMSIEQKPYEDERLSFDAALQWKINDDLQFSVSGTRMELSRIYTKQGLGFRTNNDRNYPLDRDLESTNLNDALSLAGPWYRQPRAGELYAVDVDNKQLEQIEQPMARYLMQTATMTPKGDQYNPPAQSQFASNDEFLLQETFQVGVEAFLTESLKMKVVYAHAASEKEVESYTLNLNAGQLLRPVDERATEFLGIDEDVNVVNLQSANVYYNYAAPGDLPQVGIVTGDGDIESLQAALLDQNIYALGNVWGNEKVNINKKDSLMLDFDLLLDGDFFTELEFGARVATNNVNRKQTNLRYASPSVHAITSDNWRGYDQDLSTKTMLGDHIGWENPTIPWIDEIGKEMYGVDNYMSRYLMPISDTFPGSDSAGTPSWFGVNMQHADLKNLVTELFPGRSEGNCTLYDKDVQRICTDRYPYPVDDETPEGFREYNYTLKIPAATMVLDQDYPYVIEEETRAAYFKANFANEIFGYEYMGNAGVRYVETDTKALGMNKYRIIDEDTERQAQDYNRINAEHYKWVAHEQTYSNLLPSFNLNLLITEDMFLRFAYAKTMTRPNPVDLSPSFSVPTYGLSGSRGNPALKPEKATNYDISWEWYPSDVNQFSAAVYYKELEDFLTNTYTNYFSLEDRNKDGDRTNDPVSIRQPDNGATGEIKGIELAATHTFEYLPGWLNGFGVQSNYTFTDSSQQSGFNELDGSILPIKDLSENSANLILFYDKAGFNFRAAYNYRDESYSENSTAGADPLIREYFTTSEGKQDSKEAAISLPVWNDTFKTLDLSMSYRHKGTTVYLQASNVLNEKKKRYVGDLTHTKHLLRSYNETGAFYTFGVRSRF
ncbi:TonB-dependent receptor [Saccharobesus litoralis]|nr:TonB-dependent receptor [Saccharobesus litoralis]